MKIENAKLTDQGWYKCQFSDLIASFDVFATKVFLEVLNPCITTKASTITTTKTTVTTTTELTTKITTFIDQNGLNNKNSTRPCKKIATIDICENSFQEEHECIQKCLHRHKVRGPKRPDQKFDGWSFIGGILYTVGILAIGLIVYKSAIAKRSRTSNLNYSLTTSPQVK